MPLPLICWQENQQPFTARWQSTAGIPPYSQLEVVGDELGADEAYRRMNAGIALLWRGDWVNARHLMTALSRRADRRIINRPLPAAKKLTSAAQRFGEHRKRQGERAQLLARLLVPLNANYRIPLRRGQDVQEACRAVFAAEDQAHGAADRVLALRELLSFISANEWRHAGVLIPALGTKIFPHYGVFSPLRGEYLDLINNAPLPKNCRHAIDVGCGTGVIAAILAKRGIAKITAIDSDPRACDCAHDNVCRLQLNAQISVVQCAWQQLDKNQPADLVVCNPPWLPAIPTSPIENAVYDPDSRFLRDFLQQLPKHLSPQSEGWLILSDLAEHLALRSRNDLLTWIRDAGLRILEKHDIRPRHRKSLHSQDALATIRQQEITSLWRLAQA